jgi:hypothetical protein
MAAGRNCRQHNHNLITSDATEKDKKHMQHSRAPVIGTCSPPSPSHRLVGTIYEYLWDRSIRPTIMVSGNAAERWVSEFYVRGTFWNIIISRGTLEVIWRRTVVYNTHGIMFHNLHFYSKCINIDKVCFTSNVRAITPANIVSKQCLQRGLVCVCGLFANSPHRPVICSNTKNRCYTD